MVEVVASQSNQSERFPRKRVRYTVLDSLMRYAEYLGFGEIHTKIDNKTGLKAIIAIHNLKRGPAIGGARLVAYQTVDKAMEDALRLGYMMSYKAAINNLAHGGAKAVLIKPKEIKDREAYFEMFGEFVNELGGRYVTAVDSGTSPLEMDIIARKTPYVTCTTKSGADSDPSPLTALGVRRAIEAAVRFKLGRESLAGIRVAIQGAGHVGYYLSKELKALGAEITVADINIKAIQRCVDDIGVSVCHPDEIYHADVDVFAPCALGAVLNLKTIKQLRAKIVAGSANNQLAHHHYGALLHERDILYAPDFLINAGGLIHVAVIYDHGDMKKSMEQINNIYHTVYDIFERADHENRATNEIAEKIARDRLT
ncbi:MAG: amino acid dehydrogenase [Gammaproteobacteria bacterium]|nr:amino acid dehydrogenase [Gammaproteobacteria bacterium]